MKVFIDEKELAAEDWSMPYGTVRLADHVNPKRGSVIHVEYEPSDPWYVWQFGDILKLKDTNKDLQDCRFMFIAQDDDPSANDPIYVMALVARRGWLPGDITRRNSQIFEMAEDPE